MHISSDEAYLVRPGKDALAVTRADRAAIIVDADRYFRVARRAMLAAKRRITLIGWDFDSRITVGDPADGGPALLGEFIHWLVEVNPELEIFLLRWDIGAVKSMFRGGTIRATLKWLLHPRIHIKLDHHHPTGSSHHQKIVIIDDCLAFCGGIDMFTGRWDTREHLFEDSRRKAPDGKITMPWHDATSAVTGPIVDELVALAAARWNNAGGKPALAPLSRPFRCWPDGLNIDFENVAVALSRTIPRMDDQEPVHEIEALYLDQIAGAKSMIYAESQYFASRRIALAIAERLREVGGPEIVIINPQSADGWLEPVAMDTARARLIEALRAIDHEGRFKVYHPFNAGGEAIYVHAKITVIDDEVFRIGSANMNNRSMRFDTEADLSFLARSQAERQTIAALRADLLAEHLAADPADVADTLAQTGSLIATIEALTTAGRCLRPYRTPDLSAVERWLADNEILDPEGPEAAFEPMSSRSLFSGFRGLLRRP